MSLLTCILPALVLVASHRLEAGDHTRTLDIEGQRRLYLVHVPTACAAQVRSPVVLIFHGFGTNASTMVPLCGMNAKADQAGFIAVYPQGTGVDKFRLFNGGGLRGPLADALPDDVQMVRRLLDDLGSVVGIDPRRVYAAGMSNGAMMCYRLAAELPDRIAAIAAVAGTMAAELRPPTRAVPIIHFHGTADNVMPYNGPPPEASESLGVRSVDDTMRFWAKVNRCEPTPTITAQPDIAHDDMTVKRVRYQTAAGATRVVLYRIEGGGHTWPGQTPPPAILGRSTKDISANDLIWEFFRQHPLD